MLLTSMYTWFGALLLGTSLLEVLGAERCRRQIEGYEDWFMTKNGWSRSLFGYWFFIGKPEEARAAIVTHNKLRRWVVYEGYIKAITFSLIGIYILMW
jgi:hypothetical protein